MHPLVNKLLLFALAGAVMGVAAGQSNALPTNGAVTSRNRYVASFTPILNLDFEDDSVLPPDAPLTTDAIEGRRSLLLTATRGTALLHQHHAGWTPWAGELPHRGGGAMIADRQGEVTGYALDNLQLRGQLFVGPGDVCYAGMVVGEASRAGDMVVNAVRAKEKTNIRNVDAKTFEGNNARVTLVLAVSDRQQMERVMARIRRISGVRDVERLLP